MHGPVCCRTVTIYEALVDEDKDAGGNYYMTPRYTYQWWTDAGADNNDNGAGECKLQMPAFDTGHPNLWRSQPVAAQVWL